MNFLINIDVDDLRKAVRFYTEAFGLRVGRCFGQDAVELLGGEAPIYLLVKARGTQAAPSSPHVREYSRHWTPMHLDVVVSDIGTALGRAIDAGAQLEQPIRDSSWGKLALLSDPFWHGFAAAALASKARRTALVAFIFGFVPLAQLLAEQFFQFEYLVLVPSFVAASVGGLALANYRTNRPPTVRTAA